MNIAYVPFTEKLANEKPFSKSEGAQNVLVNQWEKHKYLYINKYYIWICCYVCAFNLFLYNDWCHMCKYKN